MEIPSDEELKRLYPHIPEFDERVLQWFWDKEKNK